MGEHKCKSFSIRPAGPAPGGSKRRQIDRPCRRDRPFQWNGVVVPKCESNSCGDGWLKNVVELQQKLNARMQLVLDHYSEQRLTSLPGNRLTEAFLNAAA